MDRKEIFSRVSRELELFIGDCEIWVSPETELYSDFGMDLLDLADFQIRIQTEFSVTLPDFHYNITVGGIVDLIELALKK